MAKSHSSKHCPCTVASLARALRKDPRVVAMLGSDAIPEFAWEFVKRRMMRAQGYGRVLPMRAVAA